MIQETQAQRDARQRAGEVSTPRPFLDAVEERFGPIMLDLAANESNHVVGPWFGPGSKVPDALAVRWPRHGGLLWCNPPFKHIEPWATKAHEEQAHGARVALLVPASVCTGWFIEHVRPYAYVLELTPRVFAKEVRDCILAIYDPAMFTGRETWKWE